MGAGGMEAGGTQASVNQSFRWIPDRADDMMAEQLEAIMHRDLTGAISFDEKLNDELRVDLEELKTVRHRMKPEGGMKRRGSRGFARFLVAICIGVAGTLAWQSYGEATKQIIVTGTPELGWSPEAKQMIASAIRQVGWTTPAGLEPTAPETVTSKAPSVASLDPAQVQQMVQSLGTLRQTVEQMAAGQDELKRDIVQMHSALIDVLVKVPEPPRQPPAAAGRKPVPAPPPSSSRPPIPPQQ
jgi:hypothetical protein